MDFWNETLRTSGVVYRAGGSVICNSLSVCSHLYVEDLGYSGL